MKRLATFLTLALFALAAGSVMADGKGCEGDKAANKEKKSCCAGKSAKNAKGAQCEKPSSATTEKGKAPEGEKKAEAPTKS